MATKKNDEVVEQIVKQRRPKKSEQMQVQTDPGDNAKYIGVSLKLFNMSAISLKDPAQVEQRLAEYFQIQFEADLKPTVVGMAMALGIDRRRLWEIKAGAKMGGTSEYDLPTATLVTIKRAYDFMENLWENYMQNGKINPVSGIFLGKNNFGYQDRTEYVVTPNTRTDSDYDADDIRSRYITDSATVGQLSDSSNSDGE